MSEPTLRIEVGPHRGSCVWAAFQGTLHIDGQWAGWAQAGSRTAVTLKLLTMAEAVERRAGATQATEESR